MVIPYSVTDLSNDGDDSDDESEEQSIQERLSGMIVPMFETKQGIIEIKY